MGFDLTGVTGVTCDSRAVKDGYLFAALEGVHSNGNDYIDAAIRSGASVIVSAYDHDMPKGVRLIRAADPRKALAQIAAQFYDYKQPQTVVAVTGTNGKSSVVTFLEQLWRAEGLSGASLGTINAKLTSPDPVSLCETLAELENEGISHLAIEASSHGLDQSRMTGVRLSAGGFTNLSRDHLDYHGSMDNYLAAKSLLFSDNLASDDVAVINADIAETGFLVEKSSAPVITYGVNGEDLKIISQAPCANGMDVGLNIFGHEYDVFVPLIGGFQMMNLLCAAGLYLAKDRSKEKCDRLIDAIKRIKTVPGRLQFVPDHPLGAQVYVDYAHTPDALETVLKAVRPHVKGKLFCLFGCGGDRDKGKRPLMGMAVANHADSVIITDDNPRNEKTVDIRSQILAPIRKLGHNENVFEIDGRGAAIDFSIQQIKNDDCLIIAGKGHESGQILADRTIPFNDYEQAEQAIQRLKK